MYRKDLFEKHRLKVPATMAEYMEAVKALDDAERGNGIHGTTGQLKAGHYSLNCDWTAWLWANGGSVFGKDELFAGGDEAGMRGLTYMLDLVKAYAACRHRLDLGWPGAVDTPWKCRDGHFLGRALSRL